MSATFVITYIVGAIICGIISSFVASRKGKGGFVWFILGILLGPISLIMLIALPANEPELEKKRINSGESRKCPYCAETIKAEATLCRYCGKDVPMTPERAIGLPASMIRMIIRQIRSGERTRDQIMREWRLDKSQMDSLIQYMSESDDI